MANRLMCGPRTEQAIASASKNKYFLIGPYRVLAYGTKAGDGLQALPMDEADSFNEQELEWLQASIQSTARSKADREWESIAERGDAFLKAFRDELETERRRLENGDTAKADSTGEADGNGEGTEGNVQ